MEDAAWYMGLSIATKTKLYTQEVLVKYLSNGECGPT